MFKWKSAYWFNFSVLAQILWKVNKNEWFEIESCAQIIMDMACSDTYEHGRENVSNKKMENM